MSRKKGHIFAPAKKRYMRSIINILLLVIINVVFVYSGSATGGTEDGKSSKEKGTAAERITEEAPKEVFEEAEPEVEEPKEDVIPELTVENLKIELEKAGIEETDVVLRQAILETGWFKCTSCSLGTNNLFGFFYKGKYLKFDNWVESVKYYKWWQDKLYTGGDYYAFLKKVGYATSPNYIKHLESLKGAY